MVEQFKKALTERDMILIHQHMQPSHEEIVNSAPPNAEVNDRWLALFSEAQVSKNLKGAHKEGHTYYQNQISTT